VPLDPDAPPERLAFQLEDAAPRCVLTSAVLASRLPQGLLDRSLLIDDPTLLGALEALPQHAPPTPIASRLCIRTIPPT